MTQPLNVLVLNASLKQDETPSNTQEVAQLVLNEMQAISPISSEVIRLSDKRIPVGLGFKESEDDEWPDIVQKIIAADIVIFATPIWWGGRSSLMQRVIERMDAFDEEAIHGGRSVLLNKVAGIVITGSEDGAQAVMAGLMEVLSFLNFTLPPQCCTYWVGEVGLDPATDRERRLKNGAVAHMAKNTAKNLLHAALLLREHPYAN
ncbi:MAG: NAD(P)H-dependent oxidoreductase [Candidatus Pacebacteria bacterium]|nr:NAD(P)H-dependent oxidoreductase [Candidatus Paceibacterota bacterium]